MQIRLRCRGSGGREGGAKEGDNFDGEGHVFGSLEYGGGRFGRAVGFGNDFDFVRVDVPV